MAVSRSSTEASSQECRGCGAGGSASRIQSALTCRALEAAPSSRLPVQVLDAASSSCDLCGFDADPGIRHARAGRQNHDGIQIQLLNLRRRIDQLRGSAAALRRRRRLVDRPVRRDNRAAAARRVDRSIISRASDGGERMQAERACPRGRRRARLPFRRRSTGRTTDRRIAADDHLDAAGHHLLHEHRGHVGAKTSR